MNIIKTVLGTALLASMMIGAPGARASEEEREHDGLMVSLREVGVTISINDPLCQERDANGMYHSQSQLLIVCQDNAKWSGEEVKWTANDYDTLRHEAHHVLQDCVGGELGDGVLSDYFDDTDEYLEFISNALGVERMRVIVELYGENGASEEVILNELEAFAVADSVSASVIGNGITAVCGVK
jgi:hypothetical protein